MKYIDFVNSTIVKMKDSTFESLKKDLVGEYLSFSIIKDDNISKAELAEKACDYFEKMQIKTGKSFDNQVEAYIKGIDSIVGSRIKKAPQPKKNDSTPIVIPRSRKYYDKAMAVKNSRNLSTRNLLDYSRIMFCLYTEIIKKQYKEIDSLNFSAKCLDPDLIINSMKKEQDIHFIKIKKPRFDIQELYSFDTCTFIITLIVLYGIINDIIEGEYYHE